MVDVGRSIGKEDFGRRSCHPPAFDVGFPRLVRADAALRSETMYTTQKRYGRRRRVLAVGLAALPPFLPYPLSLLSLY